MASIELTPEDVALLREVLSAYLVDFRREVAGTENPDVRRSLNKRQGHLERILERLGRVSVEDLGGGGQADPGGRG